MMNLFASFQLRMVLILVLAFGVAELLMHDDGQGRGPVTAISSALIAPAHAVVGRPLTPVSYAGVARRTSRRTARRVSRRY